MSNRAGDIFVLLTRRRGDQALLLHHWSLVLARSPNLQDTIRVHAIGSYENGWKLDVDRSYRASLSDHFLRAVRVGHTDDIEQTTDLLIDSLPAINGDRMYNCRVWVMSAIRKLQVEGLVIVKDDNFDALERECMQYADAAAFDYRMGKLNRMDIRWALTTRHPPFS